MKKLKVIWGNWVKKIKKWGIVKMINYKDEIKKLNDIILEKEHGIRDLRDLNYIYRLNRDELEKAKIKIASLEDIVKGSDKTLKEYVKRIKELDKENDSLLTKSFNLELQIKSKNMQIQQYEEQINDYRTEGRYLVKKVRAGRTPNTNKTKISSPMKSSVIKYMREEHE